MVPSVLYVPGPISVVVPVFGRYVPGPEKRIHFVRRPPAGPALEFLYVPGPGVALIFAPYTSAFGLNRIADESKLSSLCKTL
jgi:hypothetical protein